MNAKSGLPDELRSIIDRLIKRALHGRNESLRHAIVRRDVESTRRAVADLSYYRDEQEAACMKDFEERLLAVWQSYRRVIIDAALPWSSDVRTEIDSRLSALAADDAHYIEEMLRPHVTSHGHGFSLFLRDATPTILGAVAAEIDLFATRYHAVGATLMNALQAPRYSGPLMHWLAARSALQDSPPDTLAAARDAIHTLEGIARIVTDSPKATLGDCLKLLKSSGALDGATAKGIEALWGFTNNSQGVRHGAVARIELPLAEAEYVMRSVDAAGQLLLGFDVAAT